MADVPTLSIPDDAGHRQRMILMLRYVADCEDSATDADLRVVGEDVDPRDQRAVDDLIAEGFLRAEGTNTRGLGGRFLRLAHLRVSEGGRRWLEELDRQLLSDPSTETPPATMALVVLSREVGSISPSGGW